MRTNRKIASGESVRAAGLKWRNVYVLVMSVNPGFAGQKYISSVDEKIHTLLALQKKNHFEIMLDEACSPERIHTLGVAGVKGFVLGTSALFGKGRSYRDIIWELRTTA